MAPDPLHDIARKVQALAVFFKSFDYSDAVLAVVKPVVEQIVQNLFADVPEWSVPEVVSKSDRLC